jgi:thioredoxin
MIGSREINSCLVWENLSFIINNIENIPSKLHRSIIDHRLKHRSWLTSSPIPVVVDFWAPWCGPCLSFAPTFASTATRRLGNALFAKINTQTEAGAAQAHSIKGIPTLIVFHKGKEVARTSGALDQNSLDRWLDDVGRAMPQDSK